MTTFLLDINVLIALSDPMHVHHEAAHRWFAETGGENWATCPLTENGFVRIASHPGYPNSPGGVSVVLAILRQFCALEGHRFWVEDVSILDALKADAVVTHAQLTDVYLLALAARNRGRLATFDRRLPWAAVKGGKDALEIIES